MIIIQAVIALVIWLASGHALEKIYSKAGFIHTPKFIFWIPGLNLTLLIYLAIYEWPNFKGDK